MALKKMTPAQAGIPDVGQNYIPPLGIPLYVGGGTENWGVIASRHKISAKELIEFNYKTSKPEVVNFYLERNCGCKKISSDGKNYSFAGASPGIIYAPITFGPPKIDPILLFQRYPMIPMDMRQHPKDPGKFEMKAAFQIHLELNRAVSDPTLYEYRQEIKGSGFTQQGEWVGGVWRPKQMPSAWVTGATIDAPKIDIPANKWPIPGIPFGLQKVWKEDGVRDVAAGVNHFYGHRQNPPAAATFGLDKYSAGGYRYQSEDYPGIDGTKILGLYIHIELKFIRSVVKFDKRPSDPTRKILETVKKEEFSYTCGRKIRQVSPLIADPE